MKTTSSHSTTPAPKIELQFSSQRVTGRHWSFRRCCEVVRLPFDHDARRCFAGRTIERDFTWFSRL
uniref:Uncharacterized protein n=1 Tax=Strigamia maritima TaxID=126957 RepID=T1JEG6_STRMM